MPMRVFLLGLGLVCFAFLAFLIVLFAEKEGPVFTSRPLAREPVARWACPGNYNAGRPVVVNTRIFAVCIDRRKEIGYLIELPLPAVDGVDGGVPR